MSTERWLAAVLVAQIALAAVTWWPRDRSALLPHPLLELSDETIDELRIARKPAEGEEPDWLHLVRRDDGWKIASEGDYPAKPEKVDQLIESLVGLRVRAPIATRTTSHNALKVGDEDYGRRVEITAGDLTRELVIGAAKSNSINVRFADESEVYLAGGLSEWSLRDDARSYWDSSYVSADPGEIVALSLQNAKGSLHFRRGDDGWSLDELPEGSRTDNEAVDGLLAKLTNVRLNEPVGSEVKPEHGLDSGTRVSWTIEAENESVAGGYALGAEKDSFVFVKSDNSPFVVKVTKSSLQALYDAALEDFVSTGEAAAE